MRLLQPKGCNGVIYNTLSLLESVSEVGIILAICALAFSIRLFSVLRYESIIHEFDPWFNFRSTQLLVREGFYAFHNWYDDMAWYPYGRYVGGSVYPGLMWTASIFFHFLNDIVHFTIDLRNTCVFLSPFMASMTALVTFLFTREVWNRGAGLCAAGLVALAGGYVQRSVAGSYDNEAVAITALMLAFYLWVRAINLGTIGSSTLAAIAYSYMVAAWGGYVFVLNLIAIHVLALLVLGRMSRRIYIVYSTWFIIGTLLSMLIPFVGFQPMTLTPEHIGPLGIFCLLQLYIVMQYLVATLSPSHIKLLFRTAVVLALILSSLFVVAAIMGQVPFFTARLLSLLGSSNAASLVKSVSEHQPSTWNSIFFDLHIITFLVPIGLFYIATHLTDANLFAFIYVLFGSYFASVMIRIIIVLTPGACAIAGIALNVILTTYSDVLTSPLASSVPQLQVEVNDDSDEDDSTSSPSAPQLSTKTTNTTSVYGMANRQRNVNWFIAAIVLLFVSILLYFFTVHMTHATSIAYSSPTIILMSNGPNGRVIFDDYREAYSWIKHNTPENAKILSWWDYGYQIAGMGQRTTIVDNNTRNNTQIATAGLMLASPESRAIEVMKQYDIDYVLVVFGGRIGYNSDDINKFMWILRIASGTFSELVEGSFFTADGQYRIDDSAPPAFHNSMMYKMCYYKAREGGMTTDRVRNQQVGNFDIKFDRLEEAFTTQHWMIRIYRVKKAINYPGYEEQLSIAEELNKV